MNGRITYISTLGDRSSGEGSGLDASVSYLAIEDSLNEWRLGRFIYRINAAGTARVAALIHFDKLRALGVKLHLIEQQLERTFKTELPHRENQVSPEADSPYKEQRRLASQISQAMSDLTEIGDLDGSIDNRLERSLYYINQFARATEVLRIERIEGYQSYTEFIDQRIGSVFDFVNRLSRKIFTSAK